MPVSARLHLLGEVQLAVGGERVALPRSKKTRALLAYLAVTERAHRRAALCDLLWSCVDDPRGGLRWSLSKLRPALEQCGAQLVADGEEVQLALEGVAVDALELARVARQASSASVEELAHAASLGAVFLQGIELVDEPSLHAWVVAQREELRRARERVLDAAIERLAGEPERALPFARQRARAAPDDERALAALLGLLSAAGRSREAEELYRAHASALEGKGERPSSALRAARHLAATTSAPAGAARQEVRFCAAHDGARIAWAKSGQGPPLLKTANWLNHLEVDWESPLLSHMLRALSRHHTLVRYDERGNGLSDRDVPELSLEAFVRDLEAVVDAAELDRFPLLGVSQGAAVAVAYAARHPERVSHLVVLNGFARGWRARGRENEIESGEALVTLARNGWGKRHPAFRQVFTSLFFPEADRQLADAFDELQRKATSPEVAAALIEVFGDIDVSDRLASVRAPTLVLHSRRDGLISYSEGVAIAAGIPNARFVSLDSDNHLLLATDPAFDRFVTELGAFLAA